ncbi:tape measure protein [Moraxella nonliquefaciens]|uniref:tape measure protein n=1 Tax=Moraxella nonliquefaciens TaxID=478 RepID=UPI003EE258BA
MKSLDTALTIHAGVKGINELKRLSDEIKATGTATDSLDKATDELQKSWKGLSADEQTKKVKALSDEFKRLKSISDAKIAVGLTDYQKTQGELAKLKQQFELLKNSGTLSKKELKIATESYHAKVKELNAELGKTPLQLSSLTKGVGGLMSALGVGVGLSEVVQLSDEFNNLEARVRLATESGGDFTHAMASIKDIANTTGSPLSATADLFTKLTTATKELGYSQERVTDLTRTISQAMMVSGGSAESMNAALVQLSQGLASGTLRGDELNSVLEQAPRLARAIAEGIGVTVGQIRALGAEGKITAEAISDALQNQAGQIAYEFEQMPQTVSASMTVLKNSIMGVIGDLDNELSGSSGLAGIIQNIARGIENIDPSVFYGLRLTLESLGEMAVQAYDGIMTIPNALSDVVNGLMGVEKGGESLSLLKALMDGVAISAGAVADGLTALNVIFKLVFGAVVRELGKVAYAISLVTGLGKDMAKSLMDSGQQMIDSAGDIAMNYESKLGKALNNATQTHQDKLNEQADHARAKYDEMTQHGTASATELEVAFKDYAQKAIQANDGVVDSTLKQELAQKGLQATVDETGKVIISAMNEAGQAVDGADLSKYAESFKALGIDVGEFAGGLSTKANTALSAFNDLAGVAGDNVGQLAMAYNGAKGAMGDNKAGLDALNQALDKATGGNKELAQSVKDTATAQQNAKKATDEQAKALDALGVSMSAINAGMSKSGKDMADNLKIGLSVIKDTAKGADELKVALTQALDTALASTKTKEDFKAVQTELQKAGLTAFVSSEQMRQLHAGATGTAEGVKELNDKLKEQSETLTNNDKALIQSATATKKLGDAQKETAKNADEMAKASAKASTTTQSSSKGFAQGMAKIAQGIRSQADVLTSLGATHEQINQVFDKMGKDIGKSKRGLSQLGAYFTELDNQTKNMVKSMTDMDSAVTDATESLSSQAVSMADLQKAQNTLARATSFSIEGIVKLDKAKLNNLKEQINQAQKQMDSLADTAKTTMQDLDAELASLQGREMDSQRIKQAQKLADLQAKMAEAVARGNTEEINHYSKALSLQRQINDEQNRQATNKANEQNLKAWQGDSSNNTVNLTAQDVANGWNARLEAVREQSKREAKQEFAKELMDASKRQAY